MQGCGTRALFFCVFFLPLFPVAAVPKPKATEPPAISSSSGSEKKSNLGQPTPTTNKSAANMTVAEVTTTKSTTPTDDATNDEAVDGDGIQCNEYKCWFLGPPVSY
uniref:Uncharacterized protein n=1 Tax=Plectus sambesii TaxID=2011161 RepID=A0A914XK96_9BILA